MQLTTALRLGATPRLAFVGAGGKTTAMFKLAKDLIKPKPQGEQISSVIISATTHLSIEQVKMADTHFYINTNSDLNPFIENIPPGVVMFTGPLSASDRTSGLDPDTINKVHNLANSHQIPLLIEADGSRKRPLKAPADHEPVIPAWVDCVIIVTGLSGLGQTLDNKWVHRPERFAELSGLSPGSIITTSALEKVLCNPAGGLKGIPHGARRVVMLNQADSHDLQAKAKLLAQRLLKVFNAVLVTILDSPINNEYETNQSAHSHTVKAILSVHEPIAGIVLAAGGSTRLGKPKQILPWRGKPLIHNITNTALRANLDPIIVVTGAFENQVLDALDGLPVQTASNLNWEKGQSSSIKTGLFALPPETGAAVFLLVDQPLVTDLLIRSLIDLHSKTLSPIIAPLIDGRRANPVLFDRITFMDFMKLVGDTGGRSLFSSYQVSWLDWYDSNAALDIDTLEDYEQLLDL
jgi:molybdenum cofactor cytidylyltransferase